MSATDNELEQAADALRDHLSARVAPGSLSVGGGRSPALGRSIVVIGPGVAEVSVPREWRGFPVILVRQARSVIRPEHRLGEGFGRALEEAHDKRRAARGQMPGESNADWILRRNREARGPQPGDEPLVAAAKELSLHLSPSRHPEGISIGTGADRLYVYCEQRAPAGIPGEWKGFPVEVREHQGAATAL